MKTLRLALIAAAAASLSFAAIAQTTSAPPQVEQSSGSCSSKNRPAATS
jgi:hypothetical protein